jgi:hypothetical protein
MPQELAIEYLIISREKEPPAEITVIRALAGANLGVAVYAAAGARSATTPSDRERLGTYSLTVPKLQAQARIAVYRYLDAVTAGMGEAAFNALTRGLRAVETATVREGRLALDLRLVSGEREIAQALAWVVHVLRVLLDTANAVAIDPATQRCYSRTDITRLPLHTPLAHVEFHDERWGAESRWLHTHGLQKFGRPELELVDVPHSLVGEALAFLRDLATSLASGARLIAGQEVQLDDGSRLIAVGAAPDVDHQAPFGRLRLADMPLPGEQRSDGARRFLMAAALGEATRRASAGDLAGASETIERVLAADPDDCAALTLKAQLYLRAGRPDEALVVGELMQLRAPGDFRGPLAVGAALAALGRYHEALHALNQALEREPEAADAFVLRAETLARLGQTQQAAQDRTHAAYLRR